MKKFFYFICFVNLLNAYSQSVCSPNGGTTNPVAPSNPLQPSYINHFDWTTTSPYYSINSTCSPLTSTPNPFESNQLELLSLSTSKDMKPIDGWEMIAYNLGYDNNNLALSARPEHAYVMMYNKYTGIIRILVKWCRNVNYNGALLTLKFAPGFQTNLLDMANEEKALDISHVNDPSISTVLKFYNDNNSWAYADFKLNYDPCTCSFNENSRLFLFSELISNSSVELTGKINGTISSIANGSGTASSDGNFWKSANDINGKMMKVHKGVQDFANNYQKIYKNLADGGITISAINQLGNFLNNNAFMKAGLKALPYVSTGVKFLSGLLGGGASGTQPLQLAPLSVNLDVKINGTITTSDPMHNVTIGLPGSQHQNILPGTMGGQPLYNETLGVFALLNHPVMYYTETTSQQTFLNREKTMFGNHFEITNTYDFKNRNYKLSGDVLKYAINPASGLVLQDAEVMLIVEYEKPSILFSRQYPSPQLLNLNTDTSNGLDVLGTYITNGSTVVWNGIGPIVDEENAIFQNSYRPIGILNFKNDYSLNYLYSISQSTNGGKKRELTYNPSSFTSKFSCPTWSCNWTSNGIRNFSYVQSKTDLPYSNSTLMSSDFKTNLGTTSLLNVNPSGITPRPEFLLPRVKNFKLKFILNLKRTDNPTAQNVLYVVTYPIELKLAPTGYNMTGSNYTADAATYAAQTEFTPVTQTNKIVPATQTELETLCASTTYRNNRISTTGRMSNNLQKPILDEQINQVLIYPVPANDKINVVLNKCEVISIVDFHGRVLKDFSLNKIKSTENEMSIDISNFEKGIYLLTYKDLEGNFKSEKFIIE